VWPRLPGSLKTKSKAERGAREFAQLVGRILNCSVSPAPVRAVITNDDPFEGYVALLGDDHLPSLLPLSNGCHLYMDHRFCLARRERYLATAAYTYTYQLDTDNETWVVRWEYNREPEPGYPYPHTHVHVNAQPSHYLGDKPFPDIHIPTARVTLEEIVRHLIVEHAVKPISESWEETLVATQAEFQRVQRLR
jgi:hypothetical protein